MKPQRRKRRSTEHLPGIHNQSWSPNDDFYAVSSSGGKKNLVGITRTGGIAARTTTTVPHVFPNAVVDLLDPTTLDFYSPNKTVVAYNSTKVVIAENHIVQMKPWGSMYLVDVDDC